MWPKSFSKKRREGIAEKTRVGRQSKERQGRNSKCKKVEMNRMWTQDGPLANWRKSYLEEFEENK